MPKKKHGRNSNSPKNKTPKTDCKSALRPTFVSRQLFDFIVKSKYIKFILKYISTYGKFAPVIFWSKLWQIFFPWLIFEGGGHKKEVVLSSIQPKNAVKQERSKSPEKLLLKDQVDKTITARHVSVCLTCFRFANCTPGNVADFVFGHMCDVDGKNFDDLKQVIGILKASLDQATTSSPSSAVLPQPTPPLLLTAAPPPPPLPPMPPRAPSLSSIQPAESKKIGSLEEQYVTNRNIHIWVSLALFGFFSESNSSYLSLHRRKKNRCQQIFSRNWKWVVISM